MNLRCEQLTQLRAVAAHLPTCAMYDNDLDAAMKSKISKILYIELETILVIIFNQVSRRASALTSAPRMSELAHGQNEV